MKKPLLALLVVLPYIAVAQKTATDSIQPQDLRELVVTAQRRPTPLTTLPDAVYQLPQVAIAQLHMRTTPEALSALPGVFVQKTNHGGGSPFVRGLTGNQILLLVDGIRLSNATFRYGPNQYLNTLDVFSLQNIEVLSGGGSVQYGSDALGGTVQAFTRDLEFSDKPTTFNGGVVLRGASQGMEQSLRLEQGFSARKWAFDGGLTLRRFGDLYGGDTTGRQAPTGYDEWAVNGKLKAALTPNTHLTLAHQTLQQDDVPLYHKIRLENFAINQFDRQDRSLSYLRIKHRFKQGSIFKQAEATASTQRTLEVRESQKNGSTTVRHETDRMRSLGATAQIHTAKGTWNAVHGIDQYSDLVGSERIDVDGGILPGTAKRGLYPDGATMNSTAIFSLHDVAWSKWHLTMGARWNFFGINVKDPDIGEAHLTPKALAGNGAAMYNLGMGHQVLASINSGFRVPNIDDLGTLGIVDFRYELPNYDLRPERSIQYQLGYKWDRQRTRFETFAYRNELRELITRIQQDTQKIQGYALYKKENSEQAYVQGIEANMTHAFARHWNLQANLTYAYGQNKTLGEPMRRIPPMFGRVCLRYAHKAWAFNFEYFSTSRQGRLAKADKADNRIDPNGTPAWQVLHLHSAYTWRNLRLQATLFNLFNEDYRTHGSGVNSTGRSVWLTVEWQYGR
jgi:hemoglobin/transferrin/lactoferrin receptor protein